MINYLIDKLINFHVDDDKPIQDLAVNDLQLVILVEVEWEMERWQKREEWDVEEPSIDRRKVGTGSYAD